eukprot:CAMPEP_0194155466 /NCGR_PEP_ID=MMETSP0152-20130528/64686_1 /TAXON_ID=1049557 /ORGANISM="Thalassiothrix antarctica, Strain L6-D1" /LENGTH=1083 /DNA_ID=CAMNT_0038862353 /DNA_START=98 /DNA_END=3349 /DNA_ORIENTATION=-
MNSKDENNNGRQDVPIGASSLMNLFQAPPVPDPSGNNDQERTAEASQQSNILLANTTNNTNDNNKLTNRRFESRTYTEKIRIHENNNIAESTPSVTTPLMTPIKSNRVATINAEQYNAICSPLMLPEMGSIDEDDNDTGIPSTTNGVRVASKFAGATVIARLSNCRNDFFSWTEQNLRGTILGGFMFLLYHINFCLAAAATIPGANIGTMVMMAASGVILASPVYIFMLGKENLSQYPTCDLFLTPIFARIAYDITETLASEGRSSDTVAFLSTFSVLSGLGMIGSGILIGLAATFRLADLGSYLPFPVLCGFFSSIGVLLWTLSITVDTGMPVGESFSSLANFQHTILHHGPSFIAGCIMKFYGPSNPFFVLYCIGVLVAICYCVLFITGTSMDEAQQEGWFFSPSDLESEPQGFQPPIPFAVLFSLQHVSWNAVWNSMETVVALSFLYLLRCSLHAISLKKNVKYFKRTVTRKKNTKDRNDSGVSDNDSYSSGIKRGFSSENSFKTFDTKLTRDVDNDQEENFVITAKNPTMPLSKILMVYSYSQFIAAAVGSFGVTAATASAPTMYSLGAGGRAPQYLALILLSIFYYNHFFLVAYIPKMAFSSLVVVSFLDTIIIWGYESYLKTKEKIEWLVVPIIVVCAYVMGLLQAVFLGVALSTFLFVAAFFRSGVVKYLSNGLVVRSTIERSLDASKWLDIHGDKIQVVVLQNYLFFGNSYSMLEYISEMFEEKDVAGSNLLSTSHHSSPPFPKYIILDLTLVTGMDTSTVDVLNDIKTLCITNKCKLFFAGLSPSLRATLFMGTLKPGKGDRNRRNVRYFIHLDDAIGKAEDYLLLDEKVEADSVDGLHHQSYGSYNTADTINSNDGSISFQQALHAIDIQHGKDFASELIDLYPYTTPIHLEAGKGLYSCDGGPVDDQNHGFFFIARGIMKIERDRAMTLTRGAGSYVPSALSFSGYQNHKKNPEEERKKMEDSFIRLARVGPGWMIGILEGLHAEKYPGHHLAVTSCTLHHLPFHRIKDIEEKNPQLVIRLYKLVSHLMARKAEITIGQLVTLHSIMTSHAASKPFPHAMGGCSGSAITMKR